MKRWLWLPATLAAPFLLLIRPATVWALALVPGLLLLQACRGPGGRWEVLPLTALNPALLLLAGTLLVDLWVTPDLSLSLAKIAGLLLGWLLFFSLVRYTPSRASWIVALTGFIAVGVGAALLGLVATSWFTVKFTLLNDLTGRLPLLVQGLPGAENGIHPNIMAGALLWALPPAALGAAALARYPAWFLAKPAAGPAAASRPRWLVSLGAGLAGGAALLMAGVLVLAQLRGAYLAAALTAACLALALLPERWRGPALGLGVLALAGGLWWLNQYGVQRLLAAVLDSLPAGQGAVSTVSFAQRLEIWAQAQWTLRDVPLTGLGMDVFRVARPLLYPLLSYDPAAPVAHAHNELLQAALDLGLPGMVAFLAINLGAFAMLARLLREGGAVRLLALGLGGGLLAHFLFGLTDATALGGRPGVIFWLLLGLIASLYRLVTRPAFSEEPSSA